MHTKQCSIVVLSVALVLALSIGAGAADTPAADKSSEPAVTAATPASEIAAKVTISEKDAKVKDVLDSLAKQSKEKFVVESSVKGSIASVELTDVAFETALATVCKLAKIEWRKVYVAPDSKLLEQPDRFAATVRLMCGLSFPDMVLAGSSGNRVGVHFEDKKAVQSAEDTATKSLGMTKVYLITNDAAIAAKALAKDKDKEQNTAVDKYTGMALEQIDMFMKMTPEEREQALLASMNMMDQADPAYMSTVMQTLFDSDPDTLKRMVMKQTQVLFDMSEEQRRGMMKMQMQMMGMISPEQQKMLQEDAMAIMKELQAGGQTPPAP